MRKPRVIIFNNDPRTKDALELFFQARNYETLIFNEPMICPVSGNGEECPGPYSCGDIVIMNQNTPTMNGIDLVLTQQKHGCKLSAINKAIISGPLSDGERTALAALGAAHFQTPLDFSQLIKWVAECATRMDLDRPVAIRRREERQDTRSEMLSVVLAGAGMDRVTIVNQSTCGVCCRTSHRLMKNQIITLRADSEEKSEDGLVRWVTTAEDGTFLVGLSFCV